MAATRRKTPPVNAELTGIGRVESVPSGGGGFIDEYVDFWTGAAPAFVSEKVELHALSDQVIERPNTQIVFPFALVAQVPDHPEHGPFGDLSIGDVLTYSRDGATEQREITSLEDRRDFGFIRTYTKEFVPP